ncbi:MAG: leucine-rich repeat protein [Bacteroidales bacterium]|nr:leucine-rich repeat protein [Bacteroidales bacterium]
MKKLNLLLAIFAVSIGAVQDLTARTAPTLPEAQTLESGQTYYLYNVGSKKFVYHYSSYARTSETARTGVIITALDGNYTLQFSDNNYYLYESSTGSSEMSCSSNPSASYRYFRIAETEGGYTIQRNYSYNETHFVGNNSSYYVYANQTSGNIVWQLFDEEGAQAMIHYNAKKALYDALEDAVGYGYEFAIADYDAIYVNEASTTDELNAAATALNKALNMSQGYKAPWWNERPIQFYTADGSFGQNYSYTWALPDNSYTSGRYFHRYLYDGESSSISAKVLVKEPSTLVYATDGYSGGNVKVEVDGVQVRSLSGSQYYQSPSTKTYTRHFEELEPGLHTITWTFSGTGSFVLYKVGVLSKPQITVNLLEPGSLGTEVLYNTDHIKNVRRLKVKGAMNSDDWARIKMMSTLLELDLSEAQFTKIPNNQFKVSDSDTTMNFLHKVILPEGLTTIGDYAFYNSFVEDINLPSTMQSVGQYAFNKSHVKELIMPDDMTDFYGGDNYGYCFESMYWLQKLVLPKNLTRIPNSTFHYCYYVTEVVMPEKLQTVGAYAFASCNRMQTTLPEGLETIEGYAFSYCSAFNSPLPSTLTSIGNYAFYNCTSLTKVELNVNLYSLANGVFKECSKLDTLKLMSPTVTTIQSANNYPLSDITKMVIQVPHYLVNSYKLHSYWYNAKAIDPFDYSTVEYIPLHGNLTLNHERFGGQPSLEIAGGCYLKINGDAEQQFNNIKVNNNPDEYYYGQFLNNCDNISANGDNSLTYYTKAKKWYFISLPFDLDVSRIEPGEGVQYAIRTYDGEGRAANGKSGNWKNMDRTGIIPAGTGFIFQTNIATWSYFYAADTENKYGTLRTDEFTKILAVNASETASNRGWNLVGNPYQCFYNNHCLNFTAPITIWNPDNKTYTAYSLTDDDYAIRPNEAFFVQCPNEEYNTLGFPLQGRQLTSVIESQNAAKAMLPVARTRYVVNLTIGDGEWEDQTRVVLNEKASLAYETACDASKFMSMDNSVPQIYSLDADGTQYAINERPIGEGTVKLGFYAGQSGNHTITLTRCDAKNVFLTDHLTGMTTEITDAPYSFYAEAGTDDNRFTLSFVAGELTGIQEMEQATDLDGTEVFSAEGKLLGTDASRLGTGIYIIRQGKKVSKVIVR